MFTEELEKEIGNMNWILKGAAVGLACWGMMVPATSAHAAEPAKADSVKKTATTAKNTVKKTATAKIADITLHKGGLAAGKVVDGQGNNVANLPVLIRHEGKTILKVKTRNDGTWIARGLKGGLHQVAVGRDQQIVRLWAPKTAPPTAKNFSTLVVSGKVVRGQDGYYYDPGYAPGYDQGYDQGVYADGSCPQDGGCGVGGGGLGGGGFGGLDVITLATIGTSTAALVYAIDNNNTLDDLENAAPAPQSP